MSSMADFCYEHEPDLLCFVCYQDNDKRVCMPIMPPDCFSDILFFLPLPLLYTGLFFLPLQFFIKTLLQMNLVCLHSLLGVDIADSMASISKMIPVLKLVIESYGSTKLFASLSRVDENGWSQFHVILCSDLDIDILSLLTEKLTVEQKMKLLMVKGNDGFTPLHVAAECFDSADKVRALLERLDTKQRMELMSMPTSTGCTPLHTAAAGMTNAEALEALLETFDPKQRMKLLSIKGPNDWTPVHFAAQQAKSAGSVRALLGTLDAETRMELLCMQAMEVTMMGQMINFTKVSPLHIAVVDNESVEALNALIETLDAVAIMTLLELESGSRRLNPLHEAVGSKNGAYKVKTLLHMFDAEKRTAILHKTSLSFGFQAYIRSSKDINNRGGLSERYRLLNDSDAGLTVLHLAAQNMESGDVIRALLDKLDGEQKLSLLLAAKNSNGLTPMHIAASAIKDPSHVHALIEGLNSQEIMILLSSKCYNGCTPMHIAAHMSSGKAMMALLETLDSKQRCWLFGMGIEDEGELQHWSPVHIAAYSQCTGDVITAMLGPLDSEKRMKLLSERVRVQRSPLHIALTCNARAVGSYLDRLGQEERVSLLCQPDDSQSTPVHLAAHFGLDASIIREILGSLDSEKRMKVLMSKDERQRTPLHAAFTNIEISKSIHAWLDKLSPDHIVKLLFQKDDQGLTPLHLAAISHDNADTIKALFQPLNGQQRMSLVDPDDKDITSPLKLAIEHNSNLNVAKALLDSIPSHLKIRSLVVQAEGKISLAHADTEKHMAIIRDEDMVIKMEYLNLQFPSHKRLLHVFVLIKSFLPVISFLSNNKQLDVAFCLSVLIAARTGNKKLDAFLIEQVQSHKDVIMVEKKYFDLLYLYMATDDMDALFNLLNHLACDLESDHHVLLWKDRMNNTLLHLSAASSSIHFIRKAITSQLRREINEALDSKNSDELTPYCLAGRQAVRNVLAWSKAQFGSYFLLTPPRAVIFYSDVDRCGAEGEKDNFIAALKRFCIKPDTVRNPSVYDIYRKITENLKGEVSALIVAVFSHGQRGTVEISDGLLSIDAILRHMNSTKNGTPKILVIQACQEILPAELNHDAPSSTNGSDNVDTDAKISQNASKESLSLDACVAESDAVCKAKPRSPAVPVMQGGQDQSQSTAKHFDLPGPDMCVLAATINQQYAFRNLMVPFLSQNLGKAKEDEDLHEIFLRTIDEVRHQEPSQVPEYRSTMRFKLCLKNTFNEDLEYPAPPV